MKSKSVLRHFADEQESASCIALADNLSLGKIESHRVPDDEIKLRLWEKLTAKVVILRTSKQP